MAELGTHALATILEAATSSEAHRREWAMDSLRDAAARGAPVPVEAVAVLVRALDDAGDCGETFTDWNGGAVGGDGRTVRWAAVEALGALGGTGILAVVDATRAGAPRARESLGWLVHHASADVLLALGGRAGEVGELLDAPSRRLAWALGEIAAPSQDAWDRALARLAGHPDDDVVSAAAASLGSCPRAVPAAAALADALLAPAPRVLVAAAESLERLGPILDDGRVAALVAAIGAGRLHSAWPHLFRLLSAHGRSAADLAPLLFDLVRGAPTPLRSSAPHATAMRGAAAEGLARLGDAAGAQIRDGLVDLFRTGAEPERMRALTALGDVSALANVCVGGLRVALRDPDRAVRADAATRLADLGVHAAAALPELLALIEGVDQASLPARQLAIAATRALGRLGASGRAAVPSLARLLDAPTDLQFWALMALGQLGEHGAEAIPAVEAMIVSARALGKQTQDAERALARLRGAS